MDSSRPSEAAPPATGNPSRPSGTWVRRPAPPPPPPLPPQRRLPPPRVQSVASHAPMAVERLPNAQSDATSAQPAGRTSDRGPLVRRPAPPPPPPLPPVRHPHSTAVRAAAPRPPALPLRPSTSVVSRFGVGAQHFLPPMPPQRALPTSSRDLEPAAADPLVDSPGDSFLSPLHAAQPPPPPPCDGALQALRLSALQLDRAAPPPPPPPLPCVPAEALAQPRATGPRPRPPLDGASRFLRADNAHLDQPPSPLTEEPALTGLRGALFEALRARRQGGAGGQARPPLDIRSYQRTRVEQPGQMSDQASQAWSTTDTDDSAPRPPPPLDGASRARSGAGGDALRARSSTGGGALVPPYMPRLDGASHIRSTRGANDPRPPPPAPPRVDGAGRARRRDGSTAPWPPPLD
jgi:hypothetical protein